MSAIITLISGDGKSKVTIDKGELVGYVKNGEEMIHQKGAPGWRNSDTEMFPIIGPTASNDFRVNTDRGEAIQDQHGLLRELVYEIVESAEQTAIFEKEYKADTTIKNAKYPEKSTEALVSWPYSFKFRKQFVLSNEALTVQFEVEGDTGMPFMLGYHPAFKLSGGIDELVQIESNEYTIHEILGVGDKALEILDADKLVLIKPSGTSLKISTSGFNNFMLWTPVPNMLCIEPITVYPYTGDKSLGASMFQKIDGMHQFQINIKPEVN